MCPILSFLMEVATQEINVAVTQLHCCTATLIIFIIRTFPNVNRLCLVIRFANWKIIRGRRLGFSVIYDWLPSTGGRHFLGNVRTVKLWKELACFEECQAHTCRLFGGLSHSWKVRYWAQWFSTFRIRNVLPK